MGIANRVIQNDSDDNWDRYITLIIKMMMRELMARPGEFVSFRRLSWLMNGIPSEVLGAVAEQGRNLFVFTKDDRAIKLFPDAFERAVRHGVEATAATANAAPRHSASDRWDRCGHEIDENTIPDLMGCSLSAEMLTRTCCWREICRLRAFHRNQVDDETWREICRVRGYLLARQNPRGF
jgi:hypothetical protein